MRWRRKFISHLNLAIRSESSIEALLARVERDAELGWECQAAARMEEQGERRRAVPLVVQLEEVEGRLGPDPRSTSAW